MFILCAVCASEGGLSVDHTKQYLSTSSYRHAAMHAMAVRASPSDQSMQMHHMPARRWSLSMAWLADIHVAKVPQREVGLRPALLHLDDLHLVASLA